MHLDQSEGGQAKSTPQPIELAYLVEQARIRLLNDSQSAIALCALFPELKCGPELLSLDPAEVKAGIRAMVDSARPGLFAQATADIVFADTVRRRAALQLVAGIIGTTLETWEQGDTRLKSRLALHHITGIDSSWLANVSERARYDIYDLALEIHRKYPSKLLSNIVLEGQSGQAAVECWAALNALYQVGEAKSNSDFHLLLRSCGARSQGEKTIVTSKELGRIAQELFYRVESVARRVFFPDSDLRLEVDGAHLFLCALCRLGGHEAWSSQIAIFRDILREGRPKKLGSSETEHARDEYIRLQQRVGLSEEQFSKWQKDRASIAVWDLVTGTNSTVMDWVDCKNYLHSFCQRYRQNSNTTCDDETFESIATLGEPEVVHYLKQRFPGDFVSRGQLLLQCLDRVQDMTEVLNITRKMRSLRDIIGLPPQAIRDLTDEFKVVGPKKVPFIIVTAVTSHPFALLQCGRWVDAFSCLDPLCGRDIQVMASNALDDNVKMVLSFTIRPGSLVSSNQFNRLLQVANEQLPFHVDFDNRRICIDNDTTIELEFATRRELLRLGRTHDSTPVICRERPYAQGHVAAEAINSAANFEIQKMAEDIGLQTCRIAIYPPSRNPLGFYSDNQGGVIFGDESSLA